MRNEVQLEPGRLLKSCHDAHIRCMTDHSPAFFKYSAAKFKIPVDDSDAREMFNLMNARFKQWTGRDFAEFCKQE